MIVRLLTEHHLDFLSFKGDCRGSSESTHVKMPHCWKSHFMAHFLLQLQGKDQESSQLPVEQSETVEEQKEEVSLSYKSLGILFTSVQKSPVVSLIQGLPSIMNFKSPLDFPCIRGSKAQIKA